MRRIISVTILLLLFNNTYSQSISIDTFGKCINGGCINGQGTKVYIQHGKMNEKFVGTFKNGKISGYGKYYSRCAQYYSKNDMKIEYSIYSGIWLNGKLSGKGKIKYCTGASFEGDFVNGKENGKGIYKTGNGIDGYVGNYKNGKKNGYGVETYGKGKYKYKGYFENGKYSGEGVFESENFLNKGTFEKGKLIYGSSFFKSTGSKKVGEFSDGFFIKGTVSYANGDKYIGEFIKVGNFNYKRKGRLIKTDGTVIDGEWSKYTPYNAKIYKNGVFYSQIINGNKFSKSELKKKLTIQKNVFKREKEKEFKKQLAKIAIKVGREIMNSYSQLQWHTSGFNVMKRPYTVSGDVITIPLKVTWSGTYVHRIKTYMIVFELVLNSKTNSYYITNIVANRNAEFANWLNNNIDEIIEVVTPMIDSAMESFKETMRDTDYSDYDSTNKSCYQLIDKSTNPLSGTISYKVRCKNGKTEIISYYPNKGKYSTTLLSAAFHVNKTFKDAIKDYCKCSD